MENELFKMHDYIETRWFSFENKHGLKGSATKGNSGRKHSAFVMPLMPGEKLTLAEVNASSGVVRRIWIALDRRVEVLRGVRMDFYWDGAKTPAVSVPMGDFFCQSIATYSFESALFSSPEGRSFLCTVPMPFRTSMKIIMSNECDTKIDLACYKIDCTLGDKITADDLYFHANWRRENPTTETKDFEILPHIKGRGRYMGAYFTVIANEIYKGGWWGEGEVKVFLDGDKKYPTLCGTGSEDYIGSGWEQGKFAHLNCGCPYADKEKMEYSFYRFHVPDPVFFHKDIRVTIQQIGWCGKYEENEIKPSMRHPEGGQIADFVERHDDWSACVYFYLDKPENALPELAPASARMAKTSSRKE